MTLRRGVNGWVLAMVTVTALVLSAVASARAADLPNYYVLAVGVNSYDNIRPLTGAVNDAKKVRDLFSPKKHQTLLEKDATAANIKKALRSIKDQVAARDVIVVFLSGHGGRYRGSWYFAPCDFDPRNYKGTGVSGEEIIKPLGDLIADNHRVLLIVDACFAGELRSAAEYLLDNSRDQKSGGLVLLAACVPSQYSLDGETNGKFTQALAEALDGKGSELPPSEGIGNKMITLKDVRRYLAWRIKELIRDEPKFPGISWDEQDSLCDWSFSIPETLPLTSKFIGPSEFKVPPPPPDFKRFFERRYKGLRGNVSVAPSTHSIDGVWLHERSYTRSVVIVGADGKPRKEERRWTEKFALVLTKATGTYRLYHANSEFPQMPDDREIGHGRYTYEPGKKFELDYGNDYDELGLDSLDAGSMVIVLPVRNADKTLKLKFRRAETRPK